MSFLKRRNLILLAVLHFLLLVSFLPGCKEGTSSSPVSALLTTSNLGNTVVDLSTVSDATHTIVGVVASQNTSENLANVNVSLYLDKKLAAITKTTSDGQFYFGKIPPGLYELAFSASNSLYATATYILRVLEDGTTQPAAPIIKLEAANPESITVQAKVEGEIVFSGSGTKLANINVEIEDAAGKLISTALTTSSGQFSFDKISTGTFTIKAGKASTYTEAALNVTIRDDGVVSPRYLIVSLAAKPIENFAITGFVKNQSKAGLGNLEVKIFDDINLTTPSAQPTRTTGEGKFFFESLKDAKIYYLQVSASLNSDKSDTYPVRVLANGTTSPLTAEIFVTQSESIITTDVSGKIFDAFTGGPLEYAKVKIADLNAATTDINGKFIIESLIPGNYKIEMSKSGYETMTTSFQIKNDRTTVPASLIYPLLHNIREGYGSIVGRLIDVNTGKGIQDRFVQLFIWEKKTKSKVYNGSTVTQTDWEWIPGQVLVSKTASNTENLSSNEIDLAGSFKLTHLAPGNYLAYISNTASTPASISDPGRPKNELEGQYFDWMVPLRKIGDVEIRGLEVVSGQTTYWTNYEQAYK